MLTIHAEQKNSEARTGVFKTHHAKIKTPFLMPVATKGSVKLMHPRDLKKMGVECLISNSFLLSLKPGMDIIRKHKGLHKFMNWEKGLFTDSGGFQMLSEQFLEHISDEGVNFKNPFTGKTQFFTPEDVIAIENELGADVAMVLDHVVQHGKNKQQYAEAVKRTIAWAERCKKAHANDKQLLFGITQGSLYKDLRKKCTQELNKLDFDGMAIGGLALGEDKPGMHAIIKQGNILIPREKARYVMGLGSPEDVIKAVDAGMDIFDSCYATRMARHRSIITSTGVKHITNKKFEKDMQPIDKECSCTVCQEFTSSYIAHLARGNEFNAMLYATHHNVHFIANLFKEMREAIEDNKFTNYKKTFLKKYKTKK